MSGKPNHPPQSPHDPQTSNAPKREPDPGLLRLEGQFRALTEQTIGSLQEQVKTFEAVMQTAMTAINDRSDLTTEKASLRSAVEKLTAERNSLRDSLQKTNRDRDELRTECQQLRQERTELTNSCEQMQQRLEKADGDNHRLVTANTTLEEELATVTEAAQQAQAELHSVRQSLQGQLADVRATSQSLSTRLESVENTNRRLQGAKSSLEQEVADFRERTKDLENQVEAGRRAHEQLDSVNGGLNEKIADLQSECARLKAQAEAADKERTKLLATRQTLEACLADISNKSGDAEPTVPPEVQQELNELRLRVKQLESAEQQLATLQQKIAESDASSNQEVGALRARVAELESVEQKLAEVEKQVVEGGSSDEEVASLRKRVAELEAGHADELKLRARIEELEGGRADETKLRARIKELEGGRTDETKLRARIEELEATVEFLESMEVPEDAGPSSSQPAGIVGTDGGSESIARDLSQHARSAAGIASLLRQPKLDGKQRDSAVKAAAGLAMQLDVLKTTAELSQPHHTIELSSEPTRPAAALEVAFDAVSAVAEEKQIALVKRIDPGVPEDVMTDGTRLAQLFCWALTFMTRNAVGGEVSVRLGGGSPGQPQVSFHAMNNGAGLSAEQLRNILSPSGEMAHELACFTRLCDALGGELRIEAAGKQGFGIRVSLGIPKEEAGGSDRRNSGRVLQELLQCNLGPVVDLSANGIRVIANKGLKGRVKVEIPTGSNRVLPLWGYVVWSNRLERKQFEIGMRFVEMRPGDAELLEKIARTHGLAAAG